MSKYSTTAAPSESLLDSLRKKNPFTSNAATSDPWNNGFPDVTSINRRAFEEICTLIERKAVHPREPLAGLILGEAGEGKTHLLRRILLTCQNSTPPSLFVFIKPLLNPHRPLHHLLQEIVLSLSKKSEGEDDFSQFERLVAEIIRDYVRFRITQCPQDSTPNNKRFLERFEADVFHIFNIEKVRSRSMEGIISEKVRAGSMEIIEKEAVTYIHSQVPETNKRFLDVVFQYKTPKKQGLIRDWIRGDSLDEAGCTEIGVSPRDGLSDEEREQEARKMILTLGALFTRYHLPMVLCFDQLDNLIHPDLIAGFAGMIHLLVNDAANMLPLAFIRADSWNERFNTFKDRAFSDRLESNKLTLSGCSRSEAEELVSRRIEQYFNPGTKETLAITEWLLSQMEKKLVGIHSPREVILFANQIIRNASGEPLSKVPTVSESMAAEYRTAYESVASEFDAWGPVESEYLKKAAELFLGNQENVLACEPGNDKYMTWTGTLRQSDEDANGRDIPYACFINTAKHWRTVLSTMDRCLAFLKDHPGAVCTYVTDARCDFRPTWKVTNEKRSEFERLGGNVVILDQPAAVRWYGLVSLYWKIGSGDILLETAHGLLTASEKDLANFLKTGFFAHETEGMFDRVTKKKAGPPPPPPPPQPLPSIDAICKCLAECTFPILAIDALVTKLQEKGIKTTKESCLEQIGKNQNVISLIPSRDGFVVKLVV